MSAVVRIWQLSVGSDFKKLARVHAACFEPGWCESALLDLLSQSSTVGFAVAQGEKAPATKKDLSDCDGFILARLIGEEGEILTLAVAPRQRGLGLGGALLQALIAKAQESGAKRIYLEVGSENPPAQALYSRYGFARVGMRKAYYGQKDAFVLTLSLPAKFA